MVLLLLLQLLFLLVFLVINGEPLRAVVLRRFRLFSGLDFIQVCILNVYLGGLILYALAILPLGLFSWEVIIGLTVLNTILTVVVHFRKLANVASFSKLKSFLVANKKAILTYLAVFAMLVTFLVINLSAVSGLVFGSVRDESIHSLDVQVILENHFIPMTLQPYLPEGIIYPQAAHVLFAFSFYFLRMDVPQIVFYVTILFKALSVFGAYFLGRKLGANLAYSLGLSFLVAFISGWPLYITWGANPFIVGFPLFFVCLGLLFSFSRSTEKHGIAELVVLGLLIGYAGTIIISYLETAIVVILLILVYFLFFKRAEVSRAFRELAVVVGVGFLPLSPFLLRFAMFYSYPGHNIGLAYDFSQWTGQQLYLSQALQWALTNLSPYVVLKVITLFFLFSLPVIVWKSRFSGNDKPILAFGLAIFAAATLLSFVSFFLSADLTVVSWGHQGLILSIPIGLLIVTSYVKFAKLFRNCRVKRLWRWFPKSSSGMLLIAITFLSLITAPFLYYRFFADKTELRGSYDLFAVTTQSDYELMTWMKTNLPSDAVILIHPFGSGLFIPSVSHLKVIFPYTGSSLSSSYQTLVSLLQNNTLNSQAYQIMRNWNISYVFVGTHEAYWTFNYPRWDAKLFLGNPNFKLVKNIGSSYLFELNDYDENIAFLDDFNSEPWHQYGWRNGTIGTGLSDVAIKESPSMNSSGSLSIIAQAVPALSSAMAQVGKGYANWVEREIFVPNSQNVTLSFYLNASEGFGGSDTFAVLIYNLHRNETIAITTPNEVQLNHSESDILNCSQGVFSLNLSELWQRELNSSFPNAFVLQFANYDFDGVPNIAYIDDVTVISNVKSNR